MYKLYEMGDSGNCYKVRLLLHLLGIEYQRIPTNILAGESQTTEFLNLNANGKVPLLVLPDGRPLAESNAMLLYLADGTEFLPADKYAQALVNQWLFFEQYSHEPFIATNRFWIHLLKDPATYSQAIEANHPKGERALGVMEQALTLQPYIAGTKYSVADIALYAYTHVAHQGGYDLRPFTKVHAWLDRVAAHPRHIAMTA